MSDLVALLPLTVAMMGLVFLVAGALALLTFEQRWFPAVLHCCRCAYSWSGRNKLCGRCRGRGRKTPPPPPRTPTHDWQGTLDTGPIPAVKP